MFSNKSPLFAPFGEGEGGGAAGNGDPGMEALVRRLVDEGLNKAWTSWSRKELPKVIQTQMSQSLAQMQNQLADTFLERLAEQLPADDEIDQMEMEEFANQAAQYGMTPEQFAQALQEQEEAQGNYQQQPHTAAVDPRTNGEILALRRETQQMKQRWEQSEQERTAAIKKAEEAERKSMINGALSKYPWKDDFSRNLAFKYTDDLAKRTDDGIVVIDDLPADKWIEENIGNFGGLLQPKNQMGAGAFNSGYGKKNQVPTMDQIKPGMSADERASIVNHALGALGVEPPKP